MEVSERMRRYSVLILLALLATLDCCSPKVPTYENGPVMTKRQGAGVFKEILNFMEYQPGMTVADVGAGSGALTVIMSCLMSESHIYVQDIDTTVLTARNFNKITDYYARQSDGLTKSNTYHLIIGTTDKTNLPENSFDLIYSNGTVHNFTAMDFVLSDLRGKLKPVGHIFFRDSFKSNNGEGDFCSDPKCARPLLTIEEFQTAMTRNGFRLVKESPNMSGYPVFGFSVAD